MWVSKITWLTSNDPNSGYEIHLRIYIGTRYKLQKSFSNVEETVLFQAAFRRKKKKIFGFSVRTQFAAAYLTSANLLETT